MNYNKVSKEEKTSDTQSASKIFSNYGLAIADGLEKGVSQDNSLKSTTVANCYKLNVRDKPDKLGSVILVLDVGEIVDIEQIIDGWAHIYTGTGMDGYVVVDYLEEKHSG